MFTGIIQETGKAITLKSSTNYNSIEVATSKKFLKDIKQGASVSVDGVCLTVTKILSTSLRFDVIAETLKTTNLKQLKQNSKLVNLERSMKLSDEIGGHLLSGHIHTTGEITDKTSWSRDTIDLKVMVPTRFSQYLMHKGYVGVNGCSLTIGQITRKFFTLHLIPETLSITNLKELAIGDLVNIEIDQNTINVVETVKKILKKSRKAAS
ncbi:MAG: riboflavin synthase subunit alpha [Gammaproteobacteria bacterium]